MGSYAQMVADNEFAGSIYRVREGFCSGRRCAGGGSGRNGHVVHAQLPRSEAYDEVPQAWRSVYGNLHNPDFDPDECALPVGAAIFAETALQFLQGNITT